MSTASPCSPSSSMPKAISRSLNNRVSALRWIATSSRAIRRTPRRCSPDRLKSTAEPATLVAGNAEQGVGFVDRDNDGLTPAARLARENSVRIPNESAEYRAARTALLPEEIELRRNIERVAALRRSLPPGAKIEGDYRFM